MKRTAAVVAIAILSLAMTSCDPLSRSELSLTFDASGESISVRVASDEKHLKLYHADDIDRLADDIMAGRDEWSLRFAAAAVENERISVGRSKGKLTDVTHEGRIPSAELQKFFFDVGVAVQVKRLEDSMELSLYPGASTRATRAERARVEAGLHAFSTLAAAYFESVRDLYAYLDANDGRAEALFFAAFAEEKDELPVMTERETKLAAAVRKAAEAVAEAGDGDDHDFSRLADLAYNPFPAVLTVHVDGEILALEGFRRDEKSGALIAESAAPVEALAALEGRWISPDPLAAFIQGHAETPAEAAALLASKPRKTAPVASAGEIYSALTGAIRPAARYHVRWTIKPHKAQPGR